MSRQPTLNSWNNKNTCTSNSQTCHISHISIHFLCLNVKLCDYDYLKKTQVKYDALRVKLYLSSSFGNSQTLKPMIFISPTRWVITPLIGVIFVRPFTGVITAQNTCCFSCFQRFSEIPSSKLVWQYSPFTIVKSDELWWTCISIHAWIYWMFHSSMLHIRLFWEGRFLVRSNHTYSNPAQRRPTFQHFLGAIKKLPSRLFTCKLGIVRPFL